MRILMRRMSTLSTVFALLALVTAAPAAAQEKQPDATVELSDEDGSGVHGTAVIRDVGEGDDMDAHRVELRLDGLDSDASYTVHLHRAPCADGGAALLGQKGVREDDRGQGAGTTTASEKKDDEKARTGKTTKSSDDAGTENPGVVVQARLPGGTPAACGDASTEQTKRKGQDASS